MQPIEIAIIALEILSLALVLRILASLARAVRASGDEVSLILVLGFALVGASVAVSLGFSASQDVFLIASASVFSTYLSVAGYSVMLLPRALPAGSPMLILPAVFVSGEALGAIMAFLLGLGSRSVPVSTGFLLLGISHALRALLLAVLGPASVVIMFSELLRALGLLILSTGLGGLR